MPPSTGCCCAAVPHPRRASSPRSASPSTPSVRSRPPNSSAPPPRPAPTTWSSSRASAAPCRPCCTGCGGPRPTESLPGRPPPAEEPLPRGPLPREPLPPEPPAGSPLPEPRWEADRTASCPPAPWSSPVTSASSTRSSPTDCCCGTVPDLVLANSPFDADRFRAVYEGVGADDARKRGRVRPAVPGGDGGTRPGRDRRRAVHRGLRRAALRPGRPRRPRLPAAPGRAARAAPPPPNAKC